MLLSSKRCSRGSTCDATVNDVVGAEVLADDPVVVDGVLSTAPTGVIPLAGRRRMVRRRRQPVSRDLEAKSGSIPSAWYTPQELASHYNFPPGDGGGQTIGLLEFGGGYFPNDLEEFCSLAKIPAPPAVVTISADGTPTDARDGAEGEVMLDIEVAAGVCPNAKVAVYFAHFSEKGWVTALDAAVHDQKNDPGVISVSWGYAEGNLTWTKQAITQINETSDGGNTIGAAGCTDVSSGDNTTDRIGGYSAAIGYDAVSGWGTPDGQKLAQLLP